MLAVPKRKCATFTLSENLIFCGFICGRGIETGVFVDLIHLAFHISLTALFVVLSHFSDCVMLVRESRLNEDSIAGYSLFLISPTPCCCVVP